MKILHTSDWHLGKYLEKYSRLEEQKMFIEELIKICDENKVDLIIIAGDVYDTNNPTIEAEKLFFYAIKKLSLNGKRPIVIIAGNHDSGERLMSSSPLAIEQGIILIGSPNTFIKSQKYQYFEIVKSGQGFFNIKIKNQEIVFINIPYPTEKNLNEIIFKNDENYQVSYSEKIKNILNNLAQNFTENSINIVTGHFFVLGGLECDSERKIQTIGGIYSVDSNVFPKNSSYVALGHLHRPQKINGQVPIYYSGSPIQYSRSEINYPKSVYIANFKDNNLNSLEKIKLTNYKPIEVWKCKGYEEALKKCKENSNAECWVYLEINSEYPLLASELKELRENKKDILNITVYFQEDFQEENKIDYDYNEKLNIKEHFSNFYLKEKGTLPKEDIINLFMDILEDIEE